MNTYEERILKALEDNNMEDMTNILYDFQNEINNYLQTNNYREVDSMFQNLNLPLDKKVQFFLLGTQLDYSDALNKLKNDLFPFNLMMTISRNRDEFVSLIKNDESVQELYAKFFKQNPDETLYYKMEKMEEIISLPKFREIILDDESFIARKLSSQERFFNHLPKEYGYLISLFSDEFCISKRDYLEGLLSLYTKYFSSSLSDKEIAELCFYHVKTYMKNSIIPIALQNRMEKVTYILKAILKDESYLKKIKKLQGKLNIQDFSEICTFVYKYNTTELFDQLLQTESALAEDFLLKIEYLAKNPKIKGINSLDDINNISLDDLKNIEKEKNFDVQLQILGGPASENGNAVFKNSSKREIRTIAFDGKNATKRVYPAEDHYQIIRKIYEEKGLIFPSDMMLPQEMAAEAIKKISSVTLVIENEQCHIYVPSTISIEQKMVLHKWLKNASASGQFGILVYDIEEEAYYTPNEEDSFDGKTTLEYILNLNGKTTEEELEKRNSAEERF